MSVRKITCMAVFFCRKIVNAIRHILLYNIDMTVQCEKCIIERLHML